MNVDFYQEQVAELINMVKRGKGNESDEMGILAASSYLDEQQLKDEKKLFERLPILIAHSREVESAGDFVVREHNGVSWLIVRGADGEARAFYNYCQHRGTKLVQEESGCAKRFSCPYHAWSYGVTGNLVGVPRPDLFPNLDKKSKDLKPAHLEEAFGFLWLTQDSNNPMSVGEYLGGLVPEFKTLNLGQHHVYFDKTRELNANWKFPIFAFLESYHIGTLHKDSIAEFFVENIALSEQFGPHIRSFVPRNNIGELDEADLSATKMSEFITPTNIIFPNVCMIAHPKSYSIISMFPGETPGTSTWRHMLLVPELPKTDAERAHFDKTVEVLDGITYEKEDFWVSEQLQEGLNVGAIDELVLSKNEYMLKVFSDTVDEYIDRELT